MAKSPSKSQFASPLVRAAGFSKIPVTRSSSAAQAPPAPPGTSVKEALRTPALILHVAAFTTMLAVISPFLLFRNQYWSEVLHFDPWLIGIGVFAVFALKSIASYLQDVLLAYVGQHAVSDIQNRLFKHLIHDDVAIFQAQASGTLVSHFTYDINMMRGAVSNTLLGMGRDALSVVFLIGVWVGRDVKRPQEELTPEAAAEITPDPGTTPAPAATPAIEVASQPRFATRATRASPSPCSPRTIIPWQKSLTMPVLTFYLSEILQVM